MGTVPPHWSELCATSTEIATDESIPSTFTEPGSTTPNSNLVFKSRKAGEKNTQSRAVLRELEKQDNTVVVPSDKTNRMIPVELDWYIKRMEKCISDDAVEVDKEFLDFSYDQAATELKDLAEGMEKSDVDYIESQMATHAIPRCFGLVKDHQPEKMDDEGNFPTRFVVPDNNFMAGFANVGYRLIKGIFAPNWQPRHRRPGNPGSIPMCKRPS